MNLEKLEKLAETRPVDIRFNTSQDFDKMVNLFESRGKPFTANYANHKEYLSVHRDSVCVAYGYQGDLRFEDLDIPKTPETFSVGPIPPNKFEAVLEKLKLGGYDWWKYSLRKTKKYLSAWEDNTLTSVDRKCDTGNKIFISTNAFLKEILCG